MAAFVADKSCVGAQDDEFCVAVSSLASPPPPRLLLRRGSPPPQSSSIASLGLSDREESHSPLGAGPGRDYRYARQAAEASLTEHVYSACRAGDAERLEAILAAAEADRSEEIGGIRALARECCLSPGLVVCCLRGRPRCLALLLAAGADPDASEAPPCVGRAGGFAPLRYACWGTTAGHVECAEMLLAAGAAVEAATAVGHTPLQGACFKGHLPTVRLLSSYGASRSFLLSSLRLTLTPHPPPSNQAPAAPSSSPTPPSRWPSGRATESSPLGWRRAGTGPRHSTTSTVFPSPARGFSSAPAPRYAPRPRAWRTRPRRSPWRGRARAQRRRWWSPPRSRGAPPRTLCGPSGCSGSPLSCSRSAICWRGRLRLGSRAHSPTCGWSTSFRWPSAATRRREGPSGRA